METFCGKKSGKNVQGKTTEGLQQAPPLAVRGLNSYLGIAKTNTCSKARLKNSFSRKIQGATVALPMQQRVLRSPSTKPIFVIDTRFLLRIPVGVHSNPRW